MLLLYGTRLVSAADCTPGICASRSVAARARRIASASLVRAREKSSSATTTPSGVEAGRALHIAFLHRDAEEETSRNSMTRQSAICPMTMR